MVNGLDGSGNFGGNFIDGAGRFVGQIGVGGSRKVNQGNKALAEAILQGGRQTRNPLVAALSGFIGASALKNIGDVEADEKEAERLKQQEILDKKLGFEEQRINLQERGLDLQQQQINQRAAEAAAENKRKEAKENFRRELLGQWSSASNVAGGQGGQPSQDDIIMGAIQSGDIGLADSLVKLKESQNSMPKLTKAEEQVDKEFAKEYIDFTVKGGASDMQKSLNQLSTVRKDLVDIASGRSNKNLTGPLLDIIPDFILSATNPDAIQAKEAVQEVGQRNLKAVLGGQFSEKEGELLLARAYNPALPEKENARRVNALFSAMEYAYQQKIAASNFYEENGTLKGFAGKLPKMSDFEAVLDNLDSNTEPKAEDFTLEELLEQKRKRGL